MEILTENDYFSKCNRKSITHSKVKLQVIRIMYKQNYSVILWSIRFHFLISFCKNEANLESYVIFFQLFDNSIRNLKGIANICKQVSWKFRLHFVLIQRFHILLIAPDKQSVYFEVYDLCS